MNLFLSVIFTLISIFSFGQTSKDSIDFSIAFSSCFDTDFFELSINGMKIFNNTKITTNGLSLSNVVMHQDDKGFWLTIDNRTKKLKKVLINDTLNFAISINKKLQKYKIALKNGSTILIDNCRGLNINQYHGTVYLD